LVLALLMPTLAGASDPPILLAQTSAEVEVQRLWDDFKAALMANDLERALQAIAPGIRPRYRELFSAFGNQLPMVGKDLPPLTQIVVERDRVRGVGEVSSKTIATFAQDPLGNWYIIGF
jgi:hypothetical protein